MLGLGDAYGSDDSDSDASPTITHPRTQIKSSSSSSSSATSISKPNSTSLLPAIASDDDSSEEEHEGLGLLLGSTVAAQQAQLQAQQLQAQKEAEAAKALILREQELGGSLEALTTQEQEILENKHSEWSRRLIPPMHVGSVNELTRSKIAHALANTAKGERFNVHLKNNKDFHNPAFCDQVMQLYDLDPLGSNLDPTWAGGFDQAEDDFKVIAVLQEQALEAARGVNPDPPLNPINSGSGAGNVNINMALNNPLQHNPTFPRQGKGGGGGVLLGSKGTAAVAASSGSATRGGRKPLKLSSGLAQTYPAAVITSKSSKEDVSRMVAEAAKLVTQRLAKSGHKVNVPSSGSSWTLP